MGEKRGKLFRAKDGKEDSMKGCMSEVREDERISGRGDGRMAEMVKVGERQ